MSPRIAALLLPLAVGCSDYDFANIHGKNLPAEDTASYPRDSAEPTDTQDPAQVASVKGRVCDLTGDGYVVGATAWIGWDTTGDGAADSWASDETDGDGYFLLQGVPLGEHTIHIEKGSFTTTIQVSLDEPGLTELAEEECITQDGVDIAVITGAYDSIEQILSGMGLEYDTYNGVSGSAYLDLLSDLDAMKAYDIIFINCGVSDGWISGHKSEVGLNIQHYVEGGGSIYASDWAHFFFEAAFPSALDYYGDDTRADSARVGQAGRLNVQVLDPNMAAIIGGSTADLNYDLDAWVIPESASGDVEVLLQGTAPVSWWYGGGSVNNAPLAVRYKDGGTAIYTTFHNERQNTIHMDALLEEIILSL